MSFLTFSGDVTGTNVYKSTVSWNGYDRQKVFVFDFETTGTLTGTLAFEESDSDEELIRQDQAGGTNYTDKAKWRTLTIFDDDVSGTPLSGVAITNAMADLVKFQDAGKAIRAKYTNATGSGTLAVSVSSRKA
jgi:hypothetical protein